MSVQSTGTRFIGYATRVAIVFSFSLGGTNAPQVPPPQAAAAARGTIFVDDLNSQKVIGRLGKPLGDAFEIEATVFRGSDLKTKGDSDLYLLRVNRVDGKSLGKAVLMNFSVPGFVSSHLATDIKDLYRKVHGAEPKSVSVEEIAALEQDYVGKTVRLDVYENGRFSGIPDHLPKGAFVWQDHGFGFQSWVEVIVDHSEDGR